MPKNDWFDDLERQVDEFFADATEEDLDELLRRANLSMEERLLEDAVPARPSSVPVPEGVLLHMRISPLHSWVTGSFDGTMFRTPYGGAHPSVYAWYPLAV